MNKIQSDPNPTRPILIVEPDLAEQQNLCELLAGADGFATAAVSTFAEAQTLLNTDNANFAAIIINPEMSDGDSHRHITELRRQGHRQPVVAVMNSSHEGDVLRVLGFGVLDCIGKPLRRNELLARLRAHLRAFDNTDDATFSIGQYTFRPAAKLLTDRSGRRIRLTNKETEIIKFLYRAASKVVARSSLLEQVWGFNASVTTHTLETHIYRLRQEIETDSANFHVLVSDPGGYRLNIAA